LKRIHRWFTHPDQVVHPHHEQDYPDSTGPSQVVPRTPGRAIRRLQATKVEELLQGYLDGVPVHELATRFDVNPSTVQKHVRGNGLPLRYPRLGPADIEEASNLYVSGSSLATLANHFGVGKDAIARALRKAGVTLRPRPASIVTNS